jgi:hypothetical protein
MATVNISSKYLPHTVHGSEMASALFKHLNLPKMKTIINHSPAVAGIWQQSIAKKISIYFFLVTILLSSFSRCSLDKLIDESENEKTVARASAPGDVVGKVTVGYQGWFAAVGDGSPINAWWHWTQNWSQTPSSTNNGIKSWPDTREYTTTFATGWPNLNNGQQAKLYSNWTQQTVNTHFLWMQQNGIDCAALQRFNPTGGEGPTRDGVTARVRTAAETYGRKFYIMYDVGN